MRRILSTLILTGLLSAFIGPATAQPAKEPETQGKVYYAEPGAKKDSDLEGIILEETIVGIKMKVGKDEKLIPALQVREITYTKTKADKLDYRKGFTKAANGAKIDSKLDKRLEEYGEALREFRTLANAVRDVPQAHRYINYKIAEVQASIALLDRSKIGDAVKGLAAYRDEFGRGWEVVPAMKLQAELLEIDGKLAEASKVYEELADLPDAPEDIKRTSAMLVTQMLLRGKKYKEAETRLNVLRSRLPANDPQRGSVTVMLCQARLLQNNTTGVDKDLQDVLATNSDEYLQAVGHNCLGDFYRAKMQPGQAFWEYLRVHTLHNQDRTEHARALYHLWKLFDSVKNDKIRAQECLDRLLSDKDYTGTEWQTLAKAEAKPSPMP